MTTPRGFFCWQQDCVIYNMARIEMEEEDGGKKRWGQLNSHLPYIFFLPVLCMVRAHKKV